MATLDDIVNLTIDLQTAGVSRGDFGTPIIVAPLLTFANRVRTYSSYSAAAEDDLPPSVLTALSDCFGQIPRPRQVKVGRRAVLSALIDVSTVIAFGVYSFKVGTTTYSYTATGAPTASEIAIGLAALVTADVNAAITAVDVGDSLQIAWIGEAVDAVDLTSNLEWGVITPLSGASATADDLTAILDEDRYWYGLVMTERTKQVQLDAAEWTEANEKLFITATSEADVLNPVLTTDLLSQLQASRYYRTAALYHTNASTEYPDAAWAGRVFTIQPGAETWALKSLASITPSDLKDSERTTVFAKGGNAVEFYQEQLAFTNPGKVSAGEWIDVIRFRDWLKNTAQVNLVQLMVNRPKIPYTDPGIQLCVNNLRGSLKEGQQAGGIAPDELDANNETVPGFIITYPRSVEIPASIKATRRVSLGFVARIAGAIHAADISGSLVYDLNGTV